MYLNLKRYINLFIIISIVLIGYLSFSQPDTTTPKLRINNTVVGKNNYAKKQEHWVDSVLNNMSLDEKIGQLFMISAFSNRGEADYNHLESQIKKYHVGGIIFFQGNAAKQVELTNRYQETSKTPLLIGIDAEWGLGMRLTESISFPKAITIGATNNAEIAEKVGFNIGEQCKRLGVNINFAPDADLNSNPKNPVINYRSFGESPAKVADLAVAYNRGLRKAKIMGSAKHFPGHGDTDVDSHRELPVLNHSKYTLDELDTYPFKKLISDSVASVMIGHLHVPALEDQRGIPASVSKKVVNDYLKRDLAFDGLVVTDALNMRGLLRYFPTGEAEVKAFEAGNDLLLQTGNLDIAFRKLKEKFADSTLSVSDLDIKVKKILKAKYWVGLNNYKPIEYSELAEDLNLQESQGLKREVFEKAITIIKNTDNVLPITNIGTKTIASIAIAAPEDNPFQKYLSFNTEIKNFNINGKPQRAADWANIVEKAAKSDIVIVSIHEMNNSESKNYGISNETIDMLNVLSRKTKVVVCVFGNPYALKLFDNFDTVICGYEDEPEAQWAMANVIFGVKEASGRIPVNTLAESAKLGSGISTPSLGKLDYSTARAMGFNPVKLNKIRNIVYQSISDKEFPGCQILVARKGKVIFYESFGNLRYDVLEPVTNQTIYDVASLSKVSSTVQAIMMLHDKKLIDINQKLSYYLPEVALSNKRNITIKELLLHEAGLKAFIPFWRNTKLPDNSFMPEYFVDSSFAHLNVTPKLCITPSIKDSVITGYWRRQLVLGQQNMFILTWD